MRTAIRLTQHILGSTHLPMGKLFFLLIAMILTAAIMSVAGLVGFWVIGGILAIWFARKAKSG